MIACNTFVKLLQLFELYFVVLTLPSKPYDQGIIFGGHTALKSVTCEIRCKNEYKGCYIFMKRVLLCVGFLFPAGIQVAPLRNLHFRGTDFRVLPPRHAPTWSWASPNQAVRNNTFPHHPRSHLPSRPLTFTVNSPATTPTTRSEETAILRSPDYAFPFSRVPSSTNSGSISR
jgi:hypothetical protein